MGNWDLRKDDDSKNLKMTDPKNIILKAIVRGYRMLKHLSIPYQPIIYFGLCLLIALSSITLSHAQTSTLTAKEILDRVDDLWRGGSSHGKMSMTITTTSGIICPK